MEEIVDLARGLGADAGDLGEILQRGALDRLQRPEVVEQRALALHRIRDTGSARSP